MRPDIVEGTTFEEACNIIARYLPEGWYVHVELERGSGMVVLYDPSGDIAEFCDYADNNMVQQLRAALAYAERASR